MSTSRGRFVTLEGIDGAGKSTHLEWIAESLRARGLEVIVTREPGGTPLGEALRAVLLKEAMTVETEALLMFAARQEHIACVIEPALARGQWVLCDRFSDASFAYQGGGKGLAPERLAALESWVQGGLQPDLTLLLDVPPGVARARRAESRAADRFELESDAFFARVASAYLERAKAFPRRFAVIDGSHPLAAVREQLRARLDQLTATGLDRT
jgi:dTMP kinase